jgi:hypothetical protein
MKRRRQTHTTVPRAHPPARKVAPIAAAKPLPRAPQPRPSRAIRPRAPKSELPRAAVARIVDESERSLVDVIDNLLNSGVMLNADIILALANVDLVYLRLSALLCAADRVLPTRER